MAELTKSQQVLINRIRSLKKAKNAVILCHNYQRREIYEVADFIGDSLELCRQAQTTKADMIVFCGVLFMAHSAKILNPHLKVLIPVMDAGCALSDMITASQLKEAKQRHPDAAVVCYVNSTAQVKAESDVCCTSANAPAVVRALPQKKILFVPDKNLARFVSLQVPEKEIIPWEGFCPIHERLKPEYLLMAKQEHPNAKIIAHPECTDDVRAIADYVVSTSGMVKTAQNDPAEEFICTTECGMLERIKAKVPNKKFYTVCSVCFDMKKITLELVEESLLKDQFEIIIPEDIRQKAARAFERMFEIMNREGL